jgi:prepilin-type N-terminal cleavage/methylation domain-containing protein
MMRALRDRLGSLSRDQRGLTLTELMIVMAMLLVVTGAFLTVVESVQSSLVRQQARSDTNDQLRNAIQQLDREIRSGNILYDPSAENPAFYSVRVYTQANAPTRVVPFQCVQWKIEDRKLWRRFWPPDQPNDVSDWRVLAEHLVNRELGVHAFDLDPDPNKAGRTLNVMLMGNSDFDSGRSRTVRIQTSLTGRNTSLGYPTTVCDPAPPDSPGGGDDDDEDDDDD